MCGIAGLWTHAPAADAPVRQMIRALHHRGPDSNAVWAPPDGTPALGHARLAIVDLSEAGRQPMVSRSGRYVVVYNGEIYNHLELRDALSGPVAWRGHSDTETLLEAVEQWGFERALQKCVGMFAMALWDRQSRALLLARDRMGEKPLYYGRSARGFAFASELKALRLVPGLDFTLDDAALRDYVRVGYVASPRSAYRGIAKLPPGTMLRIADPAGALPEPLPY